MKKTKVITCIGEILWDVLPTGAKPGGAPLNVALHLRNFYKNIKLISRVGYDLKGEQLLYHITSREIETGLIQKCTKYSTSEVLICIDDKNNAKYEICEPVAWDNIELTPQLIKNVKKSDCIVYGTLASRNETSRKTITALLNHQGLKIIDVNLRKPYNEQAIVEPLIKLADIVKLNDDELALIAGWNNITGSEIELLQWFANQYKCNEICLTKGEKGAILFNDAGIFEQSAFKIKVEDSVGAGDAFLAGFMYGTLSGMSNKEKLCFACATGAFVASKQGATPVFNHLEVNRLISKQNN